jgi:hypothetical protein
VRRQQVGDDELQALQRASAIGTWALPMTIEQPDPGGVSCTMRASGPTVVSWSTAKRAARRRRPSPGRRR